MSSKTAISSLVAFVVLAGAVSGLATAARAATVDADGLRIFDDAKGEVVRLVVGGTARDSVAFKPPVYGTGFFVGIPTGELRIFTAAHVVRPDEDWAPLGAKRVNRDVTHIADTDSGNLRFEPVTAVTYQTATDVAQIGLGRRSRKTARLKAVAFATAEPYFVMSWGRNSDGGGFPDQPYIRRVRYLGPDTVEARLYQFQVDDPKEGFIETESGSPVMDMDGNVVGMIVRRVRADDATDSGRSQIGLAVPTSAMNLWLSSPVLVSALEPAILKLQSLSINAELAPALSNMSGLCVFLGKRSAKFQNADTQPRAADAPFGVSFLRTVDENPANPALLTEPISVSTKAEAVNVRTRCPDIVQRPNTTDRKDRIAFYGAAYAQLTPDFDVRLKEVRKLDYLEDYFYWGVIEGVRRKGGPAAPK
jgi:hypothetical protein